MFCIVIRTMDCKSTRTVEYSQGFSFSFGGEQENPSSYRFRGSLLENQITLDTIIVQQPQPTGVHSYPCSFIYCFI